MGFKTVPVDFVPFVVPANFALEKKLGGGSFGSVASFRVGKGTVAVKRVQQPVHYDGPWSAGAHRALEPGLIEMRRMLREIKIMRHLQHENIVRLLDVLPLRPRGGDLYLVMECMYKDLHKVIVSRQRLDPDHVQFFAYQILRALKYLHSARVVHRDIKPANLFVNQNCQLKLGDFGLARQIGAPEDAASAALTEYVVTRWYRAPEVMLGQAYTEAVDLWSCGCVVAELCARRPLFPGADPCDQLRRTLQVLGAPGPAELRGLPAEARRFVLQLAGGAAKRPWACCWPERPGQQPAGPPLAEQYGPGWAVWTADLAALLDGLLAWAPERRASAAAALRAPWLKELHDPTDEPTCEKPLDWSFDAGPVHFLGVQRGLYREVCSLHPEMLERDWAEVQQTFPPDEVAQLAPLLPGPRRRKVVLDLQRLLSEDRLGAAPAADRQLHRLALRVPGILDAPACKLLKAPEDQRLLGLALAKLGLALAHRRA